MNKRTLVSIALATALGVNTNTAIAAKIVTDDIVSKTPVTNQKIQSQGYIIGLKGGVNKAATQQLQKAFTAQLKQQKIAVKHNFSLINAIAVGDMSKKQLAQLQAMDNVAFVEPDFTAYIEGSSWDEVEIQPWGVPRIKADQAWAESRGAGVKVGVIDNGVDGNTPDLAGVLVQEVDLAGGSASKFHGTHVAGTIAALHNSVGVQGAAPDVELYSIRVFNGLSGSVSTVAQGIERAVEMGLDVVNLSLGTGGNSTTLQQAVEAAYASGLIMVAATGNDSYSWLSNPAAYPETIAIGAIRKDNTKASFSNYHSTMDFMAPGTQVESTMPVGEGFSVTLTSGADLLEAYPLDRSPIGIATGQLAKVPGVGNPEDFLDAEGNSLVTGKVALIDRGEIPMREKSINAKAAGAIGMVLINSTAADAFDYSLAFCQPDDSPTTCGAGQTVPSVVIPNSLGSELTQTLPSVTIDVAVSDYGYMSGTSMAAPHGTAAVAMVKAKHPSYSTEEIRQVLANSAVDLRDPGKDKYTGWGLIDIATALSVELEPSPPVANFNYSLSGLEVSFNNLSTDADNDISGYLWDFGDGNSSTLASPVHTYADYGTYNVTLTVTDEAGHSSVTNQAVNVEELPGGALENGAAVTNISALQGEELHWWLDVAAPTGETLEDLRFAISGGSGDADIYVRYGAAPTTSTYDYRPYKGGNNEEVVVEQSALQTGRWYVMVRAYSDYSGVDLVGSYQTTVPAENVAPTSSFSYQAQGLSVTLTDLSTDSDGLVSSWAWDFGDGNSSSAQNPTHTYAADGSYTVTLTVTDDDGATHTSSQVVTVEQGSSGGGASYSNEQQLVIDDNDWLGVKSNINVDRTGDSGLVTLQLKVVHEDADQLLIKLRAPDGTKWDVSRYEAGNVADGIDKTLTFDASGIDSAGDWKLYLYDRTPGAEGYLDNWTITFPATLPAAE